MNRVGAKDLDYILIKDLLACGADGAEVAEN